LGGVWRRWCGLVDKQFLDAANGVAVVVEQHMDSPGEGDVGGAIIAAVAGALKRAKLGEFGFPIAQDMLGHAQFLRQFTDRPKGVGGLVG